MENTERITKNDVQVAYQLWREKQKKSLQIEENLDEIEDGILFHEKKDEVAYGEVYNAQLDYEYLAMTYNSQGA